MTPSQIPTTIEPPTGLLARGVVERRVRRVVGENDIEVIAYTIGPRIVTVEVWQPTEYIAVGAQVELPVEVSIYNGRASFRVSREESF